MTETDMTKEQLEQVRLWAKTKLATGEEPPWVWFYLMKLQETLDQIIGGMDATTHQAVNSPEKVRLPM